MKRSSIRVNVRVSSHQKRLLQLAAKKHSTTLSNLVLRAGRREALSFFGAQDSEYGWAYVIDVCKGYLFLNGGNYDDNDSYVDYSGRGGVKNAVIQTRIPVAYYMVFRTAASVGDVTLTEWIIDACFDYGINNPERV
ncbi:MAG TPA: DUF1778 domain-containing protein [bacterium]|nr:DUF1778 domain-containing protein [bacterium]